MGGGFYTDCPPMSKNVGQLPPPLPPPRFRHLCASVLMHGGQGQLGQVFAEWLAHWVSVSDLNAVGPGSNPGGGGGEKDIQCWNL